MSYGELVARMHAIARGLRERGLTAGDTIAVVMPNSAELLEVYGAAVQTGLTFVAPNWHLGVDEIAYIFEDSTRGLIVADERFADAGGGRCRPRRRRGAGAHRGLGRRAGQ